MKAKSRKKKTKETTKAEETKQGTLADKKRWADEGRINATGFARALPKTAQELRSRQQRASNVAAEIFAIHSQEYEKAGRMCCPQRNAEWTQDVLMMLSSELVSSFLQCIPLEFEHRTRFSATWISVQPGGHATFVVYKASKLQQVFDNVAKSWEPRFTILAGCPLKEMYSVYKVSTETFEASVDSYVDDNFDYPTQAGSSLSW